MSNKDWTGNSRSTHVILGAAVHSDHERETHDYYATEPKALELLLDSGLKLSHNVWECACGEGHLAKVLTARGYDVYATDLIHRGYGIGGVDFLQQSDTVNMDIITNPPYKYAAEFVEKALDLVTVGHKVVMFLKIQFLESKNRFQLFKKAPPRYIYVSSSRLCCAMNGDFDKYAKTNAVCYAWFVWEKGCTSEPVIRWFNTGTETPSRDWLDELLEV